MKSPFLHILFYLGVCMAMACQEKTKDVAKQSITDMDLKRGAIISCGPADKEFGNLSFDFSCSDKTKPDFNLALKMLHSFEYDEAEKVFARIIDQQPDCAMAYWGVAMSNFHALWTPPTEAELKKGAKAIEIARSISKKSKREDDYINATAVLYQDWTKTDHRTRCLNFEKAMEELNRTYPTDKETAIFYALALNAAADPMDKTFSKQKKAATILNNLYPGAPDHPGIIHYIIHSYDLPELAHLALDAARKYAAVAPSSAHALHMPSHIFTRLGLWSESINSNLESISSAQCYAEQSGLKGHWDEELHGLDYLVYAYLQKGANDSAKKQMAYLSTINDVSPLNFKVAYAFASIPARYVLENKLWSEAAGLKPHKENFPWEEYPWQKAILHFTRILGAVHTGNISLANVELKELNTTHARLIELKDSYKANQVDIQIKSAEAWIRLKEGKKEEALRLMIQAAEMEEKTGKHPVTPGEVLPARELLGDMYMQLNEPGKALEAYKADLVKHPNRFNGLYGAGLAAEKLGDQENARHYYSQLNTMVGPGNSTRTELNKVRQFLSTTAKN